MTDDIREARLRRIVEEYKAKHSSTDKENEASWQRFRAAHPEADYWVPGKPLHETMPVVVQQAWLSIPADNQAFRLAPAQRLWQVGRKLLRRVFRGIR